jgi:hypothetical protein
MVEPTPLEELHQDSKTRRRKEELAAAAEAQLAAECRFHPDTSKPAAAWRDQRALQLRSSFSISQDGREMSQRLGRCAPWPRPRPRPPAPARAGRGASGAAGQAAAAAAAAPGDQPSAACWAGRRAPASAFRPLPGPCAPCAPRRRYQELRAQRQQEALGRQQYEELRECTFTPQINSEAAAGAGAGPVLVPGLGRHLELKALAAQRQQQQKEREDKLFMARPKGNPSLFTVPQPFKLRLEEPRRPRAGSARVQQAQQKRYAECTFKPHTSVSEKRELLRHILASEDE